MKFYNYVNRFFSAKKLINSFCLDTEENGSCDPQFYYNYDTNNPINKEEDSPMSINEDCYEKPKDLNLPDNIALVSIYYR